MPWEIPVPQEFPEIREIPEPREIPETREFPRSENFPPVSRETGNSREFPAQGFPLNITDMGHAHCFALIRVLLLVDYLLLLCGCM